MIPTHYENVNFSQNEVRLLRSNKITFVLLRGCAIFVLLDFQILLQL
jgi:hypothetical protein